MARLRLRLSNVFLRAFRIRRRRRRQEQADSMFLLKNSSTSCTLPGQAARSSAAAMPSEGNQQKKKKKSSKSKKQSKSSKHRSLPGQPDKGLLLGCNPCANGSSGMVVEDYKFKLGVQRSGRGKQEQVPASGIWEREKSWNIVAKMGDKIVAKKIVLKKKKRQPAPCSVPFSSDSLQGPTTMFCDEASCLSSKYRLSTSSGDACHWESGRLVWDRELSFVSGDDLGLEDDLDLFERLESSAKDAYGFPSFRGSPRRFGSSKQFPSPDRSEDEADDEWDNEEDKEEVGKGIIQGSLGNSGSVSDVSEWSSDEKPALAKVGQCRGQAVFKESVDPYRDYMESVLAMMAANHLTKVSELEELKRCYMLLNPPELHGTIAMVFNQVLLTTED